MFGDRYGRRIPKPAHGTYRLDEKTSSTRLISKGFLNLYDTIMNKKLLIRKINMSVENLMDEKNIQETNFEQVDLFTNYKEVDEARKIQNKKIKDEKKIQNTIIDIKNKYGKNSIIKGMNLEKDATTIERNKQIGGHSG